MVRESAQGAILSVHVQPGAARTECAGLHGHSLKVRVAAPAIEGAANEALVRFLAEQLGVPKRSVVIRSGPQSRRKLVLLAGVPAQRVREVFGCS